MRAGEPRGELQGLLQGAEGLAAAGRHLGVAGLDSVQLLLDQEDLLACGTTHAGRFEGPQIRVRGVYAFMILVSTISWVSHSSVKFQTYTVVLLLMW